ncbi:MAG: DUF5309 family protein [Muribaculaceae bacterium]|nr:DUF5309 family protein [Muribaculaceae bacterium]
MENAENISTAAIAALNSSDSSSADTSIIDGTDGGKHVVDGPLSTDIVNENTDILLNEIDSRIVKIRPMATPLDQISRIAGSKRAGGMVVDFYSVDTKPTVAKIKTDFDGNGTCDGDNDVMRSIINTTNNALFEPTETILVRGVKGYNADGTPSDSDLVLYVLAKTDDGKLIVTGINGAFSASGNYPGAIPPLSKNTQLIRMGRAASELDVQTSQFESLPVKAQNFCQIFKMQIEQSTLQKIANKKVGWNFSDQEEAAIYDMRLGMEKNFLFGIKRKIYNPIKRETVMFTGGIWNQAGKDFVINPAKFTADTLVEMMREAFTGNAGGKRKILIAGSNLIERINKLETTKVIAATETFVKWGIDFTELRSKFGKLYVLLSEIFDECGMADCGMIIDPDYIQKYSHIPFSTEPLNLKAAGIRNTDAIVLTEASCLTLRYPKAHMRITTATA